MQRHVMLVAAIAVGLGLAAGTQAQTVPTGSAPVATPAMRPLTAASETGRDAAQQQRIEQGWHSGRLTGGEARKLEAGEAHIDKTEQRDLHDGSLSASERAQIRQDQNRESRAIHGQKHDARIGNPDSLKSNLEQADVLRNLEQETRLHKGVTDGSLTNRELGRMEGDEAHIDHMEARHDTLRSTARLQRADHRASRRIHRQKHDRQHRH